MKVLVACEFSGVVRDAFISAGHDAVSCDLLPTESEGPHYQRNVLEIMDSRHFDLMIAHPPCTYLASSGARWMRSRLEDVESGIQFVRDLLGAPIKRICIENPIGVLSKALRKPDQIIQPWQFGHGETKATCLWLVGLQLLKPTHIVEGREARIHREPPGPDRWKNRSRTYPGIAAAMADQWGTA
jgi:hypothetical protein